MVTNRHAFTVDLEEWFHGIELARDAWPTVSRLRRGLDKLTALLDGAGIRATFFVLGDVARKHPEVVRELAEAGHEIGSHGDVHEFVYRQTPEEFRADLRRASDAIHSAAAARPKGYRAPYFSITSESLWALDILAEEGFVYDSSVFPVRNPRYGIATAPTRPFEHRSGAMLLTEIPIAPLNLFGQRVPFSGGAYLRILPELVQRMSWAIQGRRQPLVAYIHPWELDPDHPRIELPRRVSVTHYANLKHTETRLSRLLRRQDFGSISSVFF